VSFFIPVHNIDEKEPLMEMVGGFVDNIPNIESAPLRLNALQLEHPYASRQELWKVILDHYTKQAIRETYKILGSFEFLGNPLSSINRFGSGVKNFLVEPVRGDPENFRENVKDGAKTLGKRSVHVLFGGYSKITEKISRSLSQLTFDDEYISNRNLRHFRKPANIVQGVKEGTKDLSESFASGVGGIVVQPLKGQKEEGFKGMLKGMGRGILGLPVKPLTGFLDLTSKTTAGISMQVTDFRLLRTRLPRHFENGVIVPYDLEQAFRYNALHLVENGKYSRDICIYHTDLDKRMYLVTNNRVICLRMTSNQVKWIASYSYTSAVQRTEDNKVILRKNSIFKDNKAEYNFQDPTMAISRHSYNRRDSYIIKTDINTINAVFHIVSDAYNVWKNKNKPTTLLHHISKFMKVKDPTSTLNEDEEDEVASRKKQRRRKMEGINPYFRELDTTEKHFQSMEEA